MNSLLKLIGLIGANGKWETDYKSKAESLKLKDQNYSPKPESLTRRTNSITVKISLFYKEIMSACLSSVEESHENRIN